MGIYKRPGSRHYWMSYSVKGEQYRELTKTSIHAAAMEIWKQLFCSNRLAIEPTASFSLSNGNRWIWMQA